MNVEDGDKDAIYLNSNVITTREWLSYGYLWNGIDHSGLFSLHGTNGLSSLYCVFATTIYMDREYIGVLSCLRYGGFTYTMYAGINYMQGNFHGLSVNYNNLATMLFI